MSTEVSELQMRPNEEKFLSKNKDFASIAIPIKMEMDNPCPLPPHIRGKVDSVVWNEITDIMQRVMVPKVERMQKTENNRVLWGAVAMVAIIVYHLWSIHNMNETQSLSLHSDFSPCVLWFGGSIATIISSIIVIVLLTYEVMKLRSESLLAIFNELQMELDRFTTDKLNDQITIRLTNCELCPTMQMLIPTNMGKVAFYDRNGENKSHNRNGNNGFDSNNRNNEAKAEVWSVDKESISLLPSPPNTTHHYCDDDSSSDDESTSSASSSSSSLPPNMIAMTNMDDNASYATKYRRDNDAKSAKISAREGMVQMSLQLPNGQSLPVFVPIEHAQQIGVDTETAMIDNRADTQTNGEMMLPPAIPPATGGDTNVAAGGGAAAAAFAKASDAPMPTWQENNHSEKEGHISSFQY